MSGGVNHIDTAPNYRYMQSERAIGRALIALVRKYDFLREELVISTKGGYIPEDGVQMISQRQQIH